MYDNNFNRYGSMLQRPGGVDIDELRRRRASMDSRMSPMPVSPRPRPEEDEPQQESGAAQAIRQFSQMAATGLMGQAGDRSDASPASGSQARQMPGSDQMRTPPFVPTGGNTALPPSSVFTGNNAPQIPPATPPPTLPARPASSPTSPAPSPTPQTLRQGVPTLAGRMASTPPASMPVGANELRQVIPTLGGGFAGGMPQTEFDTRSGYGVPIPGIPGTGQGIQPYDPITKARYEAATAQGTELKRKPSFWEGLKGAGLGALQGFLSTGSLGGALGGAVTGGIMRGVNPMLGRAMQFEAFQRPEIERQIARGMQMDEFMRKQRAAQMEAEKTRAEIGKIEAETGAIPGREALNRANIQSNIDYRKSRMQPSERKQPLQRITTLDENGRPVQKFVTPDEAANYPVYERPRAGKGGGEGGERLTRSALNLEAQTENKRLLAEELMSQLNAPQGLDKFQIEDLRTKAEKALREYNDLVRKLGLTYGERYETGPGQTPEGKPSPFMYYKRR